MQIENPQPSNGEKTELQPLKDPISHQTQEPAIVHKLNEMDGIEETKSTSMANQSAFTSLTQQQMKREIDPQLSQFSLNQLIIAEDVSGTLNSFQAEVVNQSPDPEEIKDPGQPIDFSKYQNIQHFQQEINESQHSTFEHKSQFSNLEESKQTSPKNNSNQNPISQDFAIIPGEIQLTKKGKKAEKLKKAKNNQDKQKELNAQVLIQNEEFKESQSQNPTVIFRTDKQNGSESMTVKNVTVENIMQHNKDTFLNFNNGEAIISSKVFQQFKNDYFGKEELLISRAIANQKVILTSQTKVRFLETEEELEDHLAKYSINFKDVLELRKLAQGAESVVYSVVHGGHGEIVVKCPLLDANKELDTIYNAITEESLFLKLVPFKKYICEIKEEIIEFNPDTNQIICYCMIVEKAALSLGNLLQVWTSDERKFKKIREEYREFFNKEKLTVIFFHAVYAIYFLHSKNVFYSDMKPENLLVFRDMTVKLGDFGVTCKLDQSENDRDKEAFIAKGCTPLFVPSKAILTKIQDGKFMSRNEMFSTDIFALKKTFDIAIAAVKNQVNVQEQLYFVNMRNDLNSLDLGAWLNKWTQLLVKEKDFVLSLSSQLKKENKLLALRNIHMFSPYFLQFEYLGFQFGLGVSDPALREIVLESEEDSYLPVMNWFECFKQMEKDAILNFMQSLSPSSKDHWVAIYNCWNKSKMKFEEHDRSIQKALSIKSQKKQQQLILNAKQTNL